MFYFSIRTDFKFSCLLFIQKTYGTLVLWGIEKFHNFKIVFIPIYIDQRQQGLRKSPKQVIESPTLHLQHCVRTALEDVWLPTQRLRLFFKNY